MKIHSGVLALLLCMHCKAREEGALQASTPQITLGELVVSASSWSECVTQIAAMVLQKTSYSDLTPVASARPYWDASEPSSRKYHLVLQDSAKQTYHAAIAMRVVDRTASKVTCEIPYDVRGASDEPIDPQDLATFTLQDNAGAEHVTLKSYPEKFHRLDSTLRTAH